MRRHPVRVGAIAAIVLLLAGVAGGLPLRAEEAAEGDDASEAPVKRIRMYVENWRFIPKEIRVTQGTRVVIDFESRDSPHAFVIKKGYKIKVPLGEDEKKRFEFVADKAGKFRFYCGRPCGNGCAKMNGTLYVDAVEDESSEDKGAE